ncbi:neural proliferation differentiation and control protein 1-like isoform X2 [Hemicordylus capensis]|uniref:neural proliferation differentiation and control protein 1-like isoform X2 n=1 Tax=Hemicordylus capensis TaxID=884348 RepID=UPI002302DDE9|nr:neural proliferation differentiation and control protein 1-like isoform X2 [Hemicordylus capensis]
MLSKAIRWLGFFAILIATGANWEADPLCPPRYKLNCLLRRRMGCGPEGGPSCGPCFPNHEEDSGGDCVPKKVSKHEGKTKTQKRPKDLPALIRSLLAKHEKGLQPQDMEITLPGSTEMFEPPNSPTPFSTFPPMNASYSVSSIPEAASSEPYEDTPVSTTMPTWRVKVDFKQRSRPPAPNLNKAVSLTLVVMCTVTGVSGLVVAAICWYRLQKEVHMAQKMAYTATRGNQYRYHQPSAYMDSRLAQSCQVHHYQHQKKLLTSEDRESPKPVEQLSTESETENGDYTVYECPGLAPSGEMEIHNPLFDTSTIHQCPP